MTFGRTSGVVFLALGLVTLAERLGYLELNSVVFLALAILGGSLMSLTRAFGTYRTGAGRPGERPKDSR
jgi:hypothetical protein